MRRHSMRAAPNGGLPFLPLDLQPGFGDRRVGIGETPVRAAPLPELRGADAPPNRQPLPGDAPGEQGLLCAESEDDAFSTNWYDACWRVLFRNLPRGDAAQRQRIGRRRELSLLGLSGHIERANAWVHIVGSAGFVLFAILRGPSGLDNTSVSGVMSTYTAGVVALTFAVSTGFHTLGTVRFAAVGASHHASYAGPLPVRQCPAPSDGGPSADDSFLWPRLFRSRRMRCSVASPSRAPTSLLLLVRWSLVLVLQRA